MDNIESLISDINYTKAQIEKFNNEYQDMMYKFKRHVLDLIYKIYIRANKESEIYKYILYYEKFDINDFSGMNFPQDIKELNYKNTEIESFNIIKSNDKEYLKIAFNVPYETIYPYKFILPLNYVKLSAGNEDEIAQLESRICNAVNLMNAILNECCIRV